MGVMTFNGVSTEDLGLVIQTPPTYEFPAKEVTTLHIPGKTGDVIVSNDSYKNVERVYYLAKKIDPSTGFIADANSIVSWLLKPNGYSRLEDSYEPLYYRMAAFNNNGSLTNLYDVATTLEVSFNCKPQRYLKSGDEAIEINSSGEWVKIVNPTSYPSFPKISLTFSRASTCTVYFKDDDNNQIYVETDGNTSGPTYIDSELKEAYNISGSKNSTTELHPDFPVLMPGDNYVKFSGSGVDHINIIPRWYTL